MSATPATAAQVRSVVERALRKDGDRRPRVLVHADPTSLPEVSLDGQEVQVVGSASPLEIRSLLAAQGDRVLVVLTGCGLHELGEDLVSRFAGRRVWTLDRWEAVKGLFGVTRISRDLSRRRYLADALIEACPVGGYPSPRSSVLDTDAALAALLRVHLQLSPDVDELVGLVRWGLQPGAAHRLTAAPVDVVADLHTALVERFGPGAEPVLGLLRAGLADYLVAWCLVGGVVHHEGGEAGAEAAVRLEVKVGSRHDGVAWRQAARAGERWLEGESEGRVTEVVTRAEALLSEVEASAAAYLSDWMPGGFDLRLERVAVALERFLAEPEDEARDSAVAEAWQELEDHRRRDRESARIERVRMAARLIRRGPAPVVWGHRLADAARAYVEDAAWVDRARVAVSRGESNATLARLYAELTERFDAARAVDGDRFATLARTAASPLPDDVIGIEAVLDEVVVPLARDRTVLVLVLDGMGWPTFLEIEAGLAGSSWVPWSDPPGSVNRPVIAVLPTVTECSRTSLFAGVVGRGDSESERRAFRDHPGLMSVSSAERPPRVEHKAGLRSGGLDSVPADLLETISDPGQRVVAVVLNNIDERLKDVTQPPDGWSLSELDPLAWILDTARRAGRAVVMTADHGHVLDRDARQVTAPGGGERWRLNDPPAGDGEVEVSGPRVVGADGEPGGTVVLPWEEQVRYATRRNGYHGGLTPQEVLVPLAVLSTEDIEGWTPRSFTPPAWWHRRVKTVDVPVVEVVALSQDVPPTLFDPTPPSASAAWVDEVLAALAERWPAQVRLTHNEVQSLLVGLDAQGGQAVALNRLADLTGLAAGRIGRYVGQLQQLVNIDGYGIVTVTGDEVRFDRALLERQLR